MTREEAIKWLRFDAEKAKAEFYDDDRGWTDGNAKAVTEAEEMGIDALAERQDGAWKKDGYYLKCSCCSFRVEPDDLQQINFCPNCGAKMT